MPCRHEGGVYFLFFLIMVCSEWTKSEFNGKSVWKKCKWPHEDRELRVLKWTNPRCRLTSSVHRDEEIEEVWRGGSEGSEVPGESRARSESELLSCSKSPSSFGLIVVLLADREPTISSRTQMFSWTSDAKKKKKRLSTAHNLHFISANFKAHNFKLSIRHLCPLRLFPRRRRVKKTTSRAPAFWFHGKKAAAPRGIMWMNERRRAAGLFAVDLSWKKICWVGGWGDIFIQ